MGVAITFLTNDDDEVMYVGNINHHWILADLFFHHQVRSQTRFILAPGSRVSLTDFYLFEQRLPRVRYRNCLLSLQSTKQHSIRFRERWRGSGTVKSRNSCWGTSLLAIRIDSVNVFYLRLVRQSCWQVRFLWFGRLVRCCRVAPLGYPLSKIGPRFFFVWVGVWERKHGQQQSGRGLYLAEYSHWWMMTTVITFFFYSFFPSVSVPNG